MPSVGAFALTTTPSSSSSELMELASLDDSSVKRSANENGSGTGIASASRQMKSPSFGVFWQTRTNNAPPLIPV